MIQTDDQGASRGTGGSADAGTVDERVILYVDDEPDVLEGLEDLITRLVPGARVLTATSGEAGVPLLDAGRLDLILSDFRMPGMDGVEFLAIARNRCPEVPRVLYTAYADPALNRRAQAEADVEEVLSKDLDVKRLLDRIAGYLNPLERRPSG